MSDGFPLVDDGIWCERKAHAADGRSSGRPGLFLDRDGVVVEEVAYLHRPEDVRVVKGAARTIAAANAAGIAVVLVTNQSGIGRGYYDWTAFQATQAAIERALSADGARLDMVLACPFSPHGQPPYAHPDHPDRKPNPGMIERGLSALDLDRAGSWLVGDRGLDVAAAKAAGLAGALHVATGYGHREAEREAALALAGPEFAVEAAPSLAAGAELVRRMVSKSGSP